VHSIGQFPISGDFSGNGAISAPEKCTLCATSVHWCLLHKHLPEYSFAISRIHFVFTRKVTQKMRPWRISRWLTNRCPSSPCRNYIGQRRLGQLEAKYLLPLAVGAQAGRLAKVGACAGQEHEEPAQRSISPAL
jgi:hypothetical protein